MAGVKHRPHVAAPHDTPRSRLRSLWPPWAAQMTAVAPSAHRLRTPGKTGQVGSKKLDVPRHFFGGRNAAQEDQVEHDLPQSSVSRWPKDNPCVRPAGLGQHDEVTVARHQHAALHEDASCCKSEAPWSSCSTVVVTSTPRSLRPAATAASMCSSRWYLISTRHPLRSTHPATAAGQEPGTCFRCQL
jgi:hypothetical protein